MTEKREKVEIDDIIGLVETDETTNSVEEVRKLRGRETMAEKRFTVKKSGNGLFYRDGDYEINNTIQFIVETVEMKLNQLSDENENLKAGFHREKDIAMKLGRECDTLFIKNRELEKKNEKLKKEIEYLKRELCNCEEDWVYEEGIL